MNYYEVLEVSCDATEDQITKSYRRLALKYHPDKNKLDNGDRFQRINEAYQVLRDNDKRKMYDTIYTDDDIFKNNDIYNNSYMNFSSIINILISLVMKIVKKDNVVIKRKTSDNDRKAIQLNIDVDLQSVYNGEIKKITIHTIRLNGEKRVKNIYIPLYDIQSEYIFKNEGDEYEDNEFTDIKVTVNIIEHATIKRDRIINDYDLYIDTSMTLYEFYSGIDREVPFFNNMCVHVKRDHNSIYSSNESMGYLVCHIERNKGLPYTDKNTNEMTRGNLFVYFHLSLPSPSEIDIDRLSIIKDIFN